MTSIGRTDRDRSLEAAVPEAGDPAPGDVEGGRRGRPSVPRTWIAALVAVLVLPLLVAATLTYTAGRSTDRLANASAARVVTAADMEREYGIKVNLVAITAAGGLVDMRFTVVDKEKAATILHDASVMPELYVEKSGTVLRAPHPLAHKLSLLDGATYFLLYPNSGGAIQRGTGVSIVIDGIRLAPIDAQS